MTLLRSLIQLVGLAVIVAGVAAVWWPLALILGGVLALVLSFGMQGE